MVKEKKPGHPAQRQSQGRSAAAKATTEQKTRTPQTVESGQAAAETAELIWGLNPVREALNGAQALHELRVAEGKAGPRLQELIDLARRREVPLRFVPMARLGAPRDARHQGVVARLAAVQTVELAALLQDYAGPLLILDCIQDPHNLGSILRSALAAGFERVIVPRERSAVLGGTVAKSSAGALSHLSICRVKNIAETLQCLKERGYWIFGAVADPYAAPIYATNFPAACCLVIGGEGRGIRPLVQKRCDQLFTIPMARGFDSLNVSAAAAVILFELARRRSAAQEQAFAGHDR